MPVNQQKRPLWLMFGFIAMFIWAMTIGLTATAQPTLNCGAGAMPEGTDILSQYSSWQEFSDSLGLLVCNYAVGSSAGFAINVEYRCPSETTDTWIGITFDHGDEEIGRGADFLHMLKSGSFTSFAGQFNSRERYWWLKDDRTIVKIIMFSNGGLTVDDVRTTLAEPLANNHNPGPRTCSSSSGGGNNDPVINSLNASNSNPDVGEEVNISVNATDPDGDNLFYKWWLNGSLTSASTPSVNLTPQESGAFTVKVEVSDGNGGTATREITIEAEGCPTTTSIPLAIQPQQASCPNELSVDLDMSPANPDVGEVITFTAEVEGAETPGNVNYKWSINGFDQGVNSPVVQWTAECGDWSVQVEVAEGSESASDSVSVSPREEELRVTLSQSTATPREGETITFSANVTGGCTDYSYEWITDGNSTSATAPSVNWNNPSPGSHNISVVVKDSTGKSASDSLSFSVLARQSSDTDVQILVDDDPLNPGEKKTITLTGDEAKELKIKCENLDVAIDLFFMRNIGVAKSEEMQLPNITGLSVTMVLLAEQEDFLRAQAFCEALNKVNQPASQALLMLQQPAQQLPSLTFQVEVQEGAAEFEVEHASLNLNVETGTTNVNSNGTSTFVVGYDPQTQESIVGSFQSSVQVLPKNNGSPVTLNAGQKVEVDQTSIGPVSSIDRSGSPGPGSDASISEALDTNNNGVLDESEVRAAITMWILGETVPGTGQTINDPAMRELISMWILGTPVASSARTASAQSFAVRGVRVASPTPTSRSIELQGHQIASAQVQVFDLSGNLIIQEHSSNGLVRFNMVSSNGKRLANGVYLYVVRAKGYSGERWQSEVRKFVILN